MDFFLFFFFFFLSTTSAEAFSADSFFVAVEEDYVGWLGCPGSGAGALSSVTVTLTSSIEAEELSFKSDCPRRFIFSIISNFSFSSFS